MTLRAFARHRLELRRLPRQEERRVAFTQSQLLRARIALLAMPGSPARQKALATLGPASPPAPSHCRSWLAHIIS